VQTEVIVNFVFTGFRQDDSVRHYVFQSVTRPSEKFTVGADLNLVRKHNIPLQELPLLCRRLLEAEDAPRKSPSLVFTEQDMLGYVEKRARVAHDAELKRRKFRVAASPRIGEAWRSKAPG
jgi:hypothetical protein